MLIYSYLMFAQMLQLLIEYSLKVIHEPVYYAITVACNNVKLADWLVVNGFAFILFQ